MTASTITKSTMERYAIRVGHEWATICVREFISSVPTSDRDPYFGGEILINSSFGSWANTWGACGRRFKKFLTEVEFDYTFGKFMGTRLRVFDGEGSVKQLRQRLLDARRHDEVSKEVARDCWDAIEDKEGELEDSGNSFVDGVFDIRRDLKPDLFPEPWNLITQRYDHQAEGFWREIWPVFKAELQRELEEVPA